MESILGNFIKSTPLFSFNTILDENVGLIRLIYKKYNDKDIFDFTSIEKEPMSKLVSLVYYKPYYNPLKLFLKDKSKEDFIDECYQEFLETKEDEIIAEGVITEIANLVKSFKESGDVNPTVYYYNKYQKDALESLPHLRGIHLVDFKDVDIQEYSQLYLRYYYELLMFEKFSHRTIYLASDEFNKYALDQLFSEEFEDINSMINNLNKVCIFDIYKSNIVKKENLYVSTDQSNNE